MIRALIAVLLLGAVSSFGYGFWLVLAPERHHWKIEIPLDQPGSTQSAEPSEKARETDAPMPRAAAAAAPTPPAAVDLVSPDAIIPATLATSGPTHLARAEKGAATDRPITLGLPIACSPGTDCWVVNFVDLDPGPGRRDFMCNQMSYDGHKGTDIGLANEARLADNVPVLASASGKVVGVRDGEPEAGRAGIAAAKAAGRECGNGVRIDHGDGWATQYCHMRKGSVLVSAGQQVDAGQVLGSVGLSGVTEFPHVHLSVSHNGEVIDPFKGVAGGPDCEPGTQPLWDETTEAKLLSVLPPVLLDAAFSDTVPSPEAAESGQAARETLGRDAPAVVLWFRAAGVAPGDTARVTIATPTGETVVDQTVQIDRNQAWIFRAFGLKNTQKRFPGGLVPGTWRGRVTLKRGDMTSVDSRLTLVVGR